MKERRKKTTLIQTFTMMGLVILLISLIVTGWWISRQITSTVVSRVGHTTSLFAGSVIAPYRLEMIDNGSSVDLEHIIARSSLADDIVGFKVWGRQGLILYSTIESEIGSIFPVEAGLKEAWEGIVSAELSDLNRDEHEEQRKLADKLIETYSPIR